jgi:hypothetical protein
MPGLGLVGKVAREGGHLAERAAKDAARGAVWAAAAPRPRSGGTSSLERARAHNAERGANWRDALDESRARRRAAGTPGSRGEVAVPDESVIEPTASNVTQPPKTAAELAGDMERAREKSALADPDDGPVMRMRPRQEEEAIALLNRVLTEIVLLLQEYVWFPSPAAYIAIALWIVHAACRDGERNLLWRASPRLLITSLLNGSGKTTVLEIIGMILRAADGVMLHTTPYGLATTLGVENSVALVDDIQLCFGATGEAGKDLMKVLLGSYKRGATWRSGKGNGRRTPSYGPVGSAGKDEIIKKLRQAPQVKDFLARSVIIRTGRPAVYMPELDESADERCEKIAVALEAVAGQLQDAFLAAARKLAEQNRGHTITDGDGGRTAQIWRPLFAVAMVAGGEWIRAAVASADQLTAGSGDLISAEEALRSLRRDVGSDADGTAGAPAPSIWTGEFATLAGLTETEG